MASHRASVPAAVDILYLAGHVDAAHRCAPITPAPHRACSVLEEANPASGGQPLRGPSLRPTSRVMKRPRKAPVPMTEGLRALNHPNECGGRHEAPKAVACYATTTYG